MPSYLVVDDSKPIRMVLASSLKAAAGPGTEVLEADTDEKALQLFLDHPVEVVFLDMVMGDLGTNLHLLKTMLQARPEARIVLTTGLEREHPDVVAAISEGAFSYLRKPIRVDGVREVLSQVDAETGRSERIR